jgi:hypothetical protein
MSILEKAREFISSNARLLERRLFAYHFEGGSRETVVAALHAYQNADGGFGNALEPDKRIASSQPIDQEIALRVLDEVGLENELVQQLCSFLMTITTAEGGVPFTLSTVTDAPHAPWWHTDEKNPPASLNPTASIAGLLHKHDIKHEWLERATTFCWERLEAKHEVHTLLCILLFLEYNSDTQRAKKAFEGIKEQILKNTALETNAEGYVHPPYIFAPTPTSLARTLYDDAFINKHLDALVAKQQDDGGWPISWPAVTPACELEYRGITTLNALKTLKSYGKLR